VLDCKPILLPLLLYIVHPSARLKACSVKRLILAVASCGVLVSGCHGIEHPGGPAAPSTPTVPTSLALVASTSQFPAGGGRCAIDVSVMPTNGEAIAVELVSTTGTLNPSSVVTDRSGHARVEWKGDRSTTIAATSGTLAASVSIHVAGATAPPAPGPGPGPDVPTPGPTVPSPSGGSISIGIDAGPSPAYALEPMLFTAHVQVLPPSAVTSIAWNFGETGGTDAETSPTLWTYRTAGSQTASVIVLTADGRRGEGSIRLVLRPADELAVSLGAAPIPAVVRDEVTWSAAVSAHSGGVPDLTYSWDFDGNGVVDATTSGPDATTTYFAPGRLTARVTIRSADGRTAAASREIEITPAAK
jgi:hypothetical protein